jgi:hypothetical protein
MPDREILKLAYIFRPAWDSYDQKQAHPSTAKEGNTDPEAVFPLIERDEEKVTYD